MPLDTLIFDASACGFPKPRVSLLPVGLNGVSRASGRRWAPATHFRHFARSRYALREAYRRAEEGLAALHSSRWIARHANADEVTHRRRGNYQHWAATPRSLAHCRPLAPELPEGCTPYMLPLILAQPAPHFALLKKLGVPIYRWYCIAACTCPAALDYRLRLLHLPCHQSITPPPQLDWMIAAVQKVTCRSIR